jgi:hypothetical protein
VTVKKEITSVLITSVFTVFVSLGISPGALAASAASNNLIVAVSSASSEQQVLEQLKTAGDPLTAEEVTAITAGLPESALIAAGGARLIQPERVGWKLHTGKTMLAFKIDDGGLGMSALTLLLDASLNVEHTIQAVAALAGDELSVQQWIDGRPSSTESISAGKKLGMPAVNSSRTVVAQGTTPSTTTTSSQVISRGAGLGLAPAGSPAGLQASATSSSSISATMTTTSAKWHPFSLSRFNSCLSNAGIAWWIVAMVASVCFALGVTTAGIAFMACVVGTLGVGSGTTGYCFGYATYY